MKYGSVCSGIEAARVAFPDHWQADWFAEIDPFCCALLKDKYPEVPNLGDITSRTLFPKVDLVIGGTPCQSFSIQGLRKGMDDDRGKLTLRFCEIVRDARPRWVIWENVPNVLQSDGGRAFGGFVGALGELGYGFAYRVLDAQFFGVPQRRRRVFVVANPDWRRAAAVLFDRPQHSEAAGAAYEIQQERQSADGLFEPLLGWTGDETPKHAVEVVPTLRAQQGGEGVGYIGRGGLDRLTVTEWERLQGLPDDYTKLEGWSDRARRTAIGNSFAVPVVRWIANRIDFLEGLI